MEASTPSFPADTTTTMPAATASRTASTHVYLIDSGVTSKDIRTVEKKDFTMLFTSQDDVYWEDSLYVEAPFFDPGSAGNPEDELGHGTHLAGTLAAQDDNTGVVGVAPGMALHSLKVLTAEGQTDVTTVIAALTYGDAPEGECPSGFRSGADKPQPRDGYRELNV